MYVLKPCCPAALVRCSNLKKWIRNYHQCGSLISRLLFRSNLSTEQLASGVTWAVT